jgi:mRNA-degrading endonuclease RelE of RelBE toxin-antitoxin system
MRVVIAEEALSDVTSLSTTMRARLDTVITRLEAWPNVSGAKPLRREWKGHYRIRRGDWRVSKSSNPT